MIAPPRTPPVPQNLRQYLSVVYPLGFRRAWPRPPRSRPSSREPGADVLAELAVRAPFGSYLRRSATGSGEESYEIDLRWMSGYPVREALARPGGLARFAVRDGRLVTTLGAAGRRAPGAGPRGDAGRPERGPHDVPAQPVDPPDHADVVRAGHHQPARRPATRCAGCCTTASTRCWSATGRSPSSRSGARGFSATIFSHDGASWPGWRRARQPLRLLGFRAGHPVPQPRHRADAVRLPVPGQRDAPLVGDAPPTSRSTCGSTTRGDDAVTPTPSSPAGSANSTGSSRTASPAPTGPSGSGGWPGCAPR